jgi:hypothetical protein
MEDQKVYKNIKLDSPSITGKVTGEHQTTQEDWRLPTLLNSWVNLDVSLYNSAGYMKDTNGFVHLKGLIMSGTIGYNTPAFTLPSGYRPNRTSLFAIESNDLFGACRVHANGDVCITAPSSNTWACLDGITFRAEK